MASLCPVKLLVPRILAALIGAALIVAAYSADSRALALSGAIALLSAEVLSLLGLRSAHESPASRALLGVCESACAIALSLIEPAAMLVALTQIVYSVMASGMATVSVSLGRALPKQRGESMRRILGAAANVGLCLIALHAAAVLDVQRELKLSARDLALLCTALVVIASARSITELALSTKWTK
jgi:hypothetical protein